MHRKTNKHGMKEILHRLEKTDLNEKRGIAVFIFCFLKAIEILSKLYILLLLYTLKKKKVSKLNTLIYVFKR